MSAARELGAISLASIGPSAGFELSLRHGRDPACAECGVNALNREAGLAIIRDNGSHGTFIIQHVGSPVHAGSNLDARGPMIRQHLAGKRKSPESKHVGRPVHAGSSLDDLDPTIHLH